MAFMYKYPLLKARVIDGDTIEATLDLGFGITVTKMIQLAGIDVPDMKGPGSSENKQLAEICKEIVEEEIPFFSDPYIETIEDKQEKYGRVVGTIYSRKNNSYVNINDFLKFRMHPFIHPDPNGTGEIEE